MIKKYGVVVKILKIASTIEAVREPKSTVISDISSDFIYLRAIALHAGETNGPNGNGDYFSRRELLKSYATFIGKPVDFNHDREQIIGTILDAYPVEDSESKEFYIECLLKIDKKLDPKIARQIETGILNKVSMECSVGQCACSICGTVATIKEEFCEHLQPQAVLKEYTALRDKEELGIKRGQKTKAFSENIGLNFTGLAAVYDPADRGADVISRLAEQKGVEDMTVTAEEVLKKLNGMEALALRQLFEKMIKTAQNKLYEGVDAPHPDESTTKAVNIDPQSQPQLKEGLQPSTSGTEAGSPILPGHESAIKAEEKKGKALEKEVGSTKGKYKLAEQLYEMVKTSLAADLLRKSVNKIAEAMKLTPEEAMKLKEDSVKQIITEVLDKKEATSKEAEKIEPGTSAKDVDEKQTMQPVDHLKKVPVETTKELDKGAAVAPGTSATDVKESQKVQPELSGLKAEESSTKKELGLETHKASVEAIAQAVPGTSAVDVKQQQSTQPQMKQDIKKETTDAVNLDGEGKSAEVTGSAVDKPVQQHMQPSHTVGKVPVETTKLVNIANLKTEFIESKEKPELSEWVLKDEEKKAVLLKATLGDLWGRELKNQMEYATSSKYGEALVSKVAKYGLSKVAAVLGKANGFDYQWYVKMGEYLEPGKGTSVVPKELLDQRAKEMKAAPDKPLSDKLASQEKIAEETGTTSTALTPLTEVRDYATSSSSSDVKVDIKTEATQTKKASAFDKMEVLMVGEGYQAVKNKETNKIEVKDKDGKVVAEYTDAFGDDVASIMQLLREMLKLEEKAPEEESKELELPKELEEPKEELKEEKPEEAKMHEGAKATPEAQEFISSKIKKLIGEGYAQEQAAAIAYSMAKEKGFDVPEAPKKSSQDNEVKEAFRLVKEMKIKEAIEKRVSRCKGIVSEMGRKGILVEDEKVVAQLVNDGFPIEEAREKAFKKAMNEQLKELLASDDISVSAMERTVQRVAVAKTASIDSGADFKLPGKMPSESQTGDPDMVFLGKIFSGSRKKN